MILFWVHLCKGCGGQRAGDLCRDWNGVIECNLLQQGLGSRGWLGPFFLSIPFCCFDSFWDFPSHFLIKFSFIKKKKNKKEIRGVKPPLKKIRDVNKALLSKWLWRFGNGDNSLWKRVIKGKYDAISKWETNRVTFSHGVSLWKGIMGMADQFKEATRMEVGRNVLYWEYTWYCPRPLRLEFPIIFNIVLDKGASVANNWCREGGIGNWNIQLRFALASF